MNRNIRPWRLVILLMTGAFLGFPALSGQDVDAYADIAIKNSPAIRASQTMHQAIMEQLPQVQSWPEPQLNGSFFINPMMLPMGNQLGSISAMQMVPWKSVLNAKSTEVEKKAAIYLGESDVIANELTYRVYQAWYPLIANREKQALQKQNLDLLDDIRELATTQFTQGKGSLSDVLRVDILKEDLLTNLEILQAEQSSLERQFNLLLNRDDDAILLYPEALESIGAVQSRDTSFRSNPALALLDQRADVAAAAARTADLGRKPTVGAGLQYMPLIRRKNATIELPPNTGRDMIMPMFSVTIPIWKKKYDAAVQEQQLMQIQYGEQKETLRLELQNEEERLHFLMEKTLANHKKLDRQAEKTQEILHLMTTEYQNGLGDMAELLRLEQQLLNYQLEQVDLKVNYYQLKAQKAMLHGVFSPNY